MGHSDYHTVIEMRHWSADIAAFLVLLAVASTHGVGASHYRGGLIEYTSTGSQTTFTVTQSWRLVWAGADSLPIVR